ncbi:MAG: CBS domain-containing protein [Candidatus Thermoplasmatota archaeon]|nr:CBS domain-containing protein [Euryarchaeota archaeon]MBU4032000.1 CBS domain-containing protein [Candidatus Thermoplasmatota archaeon]MBU4071609.1 CBS domain-containing protein [Candidatus Thermoplasmatota archaeon]MBU4144374.1 CBS domain-containing protein [Candidatus Thermoplasmatota archaeon]MBU4592772.1 CBS domain-containing protein [Candidatus Thermoplasmatota archaeon]
MKIEDIMTRKVITLNSSQTVAEAVDKLAENGISGAPVVDDDGQVVGILTESDILDAIKTRSKRVEMVYPSLSSLSVAFVKKDDLKETLEAFAEIAETPISDIMQNDVIYADKNTDLTAVVEKMNSTGINRVPIMDSGKLVGIVSRADIIKGLAKVKIVNGD